MAQPAKKPAKKSENKTKPTPVSVGAFLDSVEHDTRRQDGYALCDLMARISGQEPVMWGPTIVGFGQYHYKYDSGREGDMCRIGFSPRKSSLSLYVTCDATRHADILSRLGKHKTGAGCIYVNKLADVDMKVMEELVRAGWDHMARTYPA